MKMTQVRYVLATAKYRSFSAAAEHLYVAQPTLSQQIRLLERELGVSLFSRTTREVSLTPAGTEFVRIASQADESFTKLEALAKKFASPLAGPLRLGLLWSFTYLRLDRLLAAFSQEYPEITLEYVIGGSLELSEKLAAGTLDAAFSNAPYTDGESIVVCESPVCAVLNAKHPLAKRRRLRAADLAECTLLLPGEHSTIERDVLAFLGPVTENARIIGRSGQIDVCRQIAASNMAVTFLSRFIAEYWTDGVTRAVPLSPEIIRSTYLITPRPNTCTPTAKTFANFAKQYLSDGRLEENTSPSQ